MFLVGFYKPTKNREFSKTAQFQFWRNTFVFQVAMLNWPALPLKSGACAVDYYWFGRMRSSCLWPFPSNVRELADAASNVTSSIRNIPTTELLTYCNIRPKQAVNFCIIWGFGWVKTISGPSAAARGRAPQLGDQALRPWVHKSDVKPRDSRSDRIMMDLA